MARYIAAGGVAYLAEMMSLALLLFVFYTTPLAAAAIGFWVGFVVAFVLQKYVAFQDSRHQRRVLVTQVVLYSLLVLWNYAFTLGMVALLTPALSVFVVRTAAILLISIWNYVIYRRLFAAKAFHWPRPAMMIAGCSVLVLLATTALWSTLGARVQYANADQLADVYLFHDAATFHQAVLPGAHSFLLKWPLFWLASALGSSELVLTVMTVLICVATIAALAFMLHRIERRPLVYGGLCLSLAAMLLLVPAQPYAGGLLPVNMAMLTTRNLEYVVYALALLALIRAGKLRSWWVVTSIGLLTLLVASDKLFATLSIGGALLATVCAALVRRGNQIRVALWWLLVSVMSLLLATGLLWLLDAASVVHIINQTSGSPYAFIHSLHQFLLGAIYAILGLLTNMGANPMLGLTTLFEAPRLLLARLLSPAGIGYVVNAVTAGAALLATSIITYGYYARQPKQSLPKLWPSLTVLLSWSSVTAVGAFVLIDHGFSVDARYEGVILFAVAIGAASFVSQRKIPTKLIICWLALAVLACLSGLWGTIGQYNQQQAASNTVLQRNKAVAEILQAHHVDVLVGNYWRVLPIKAVDQQTQVFPLSGCTDYRDTLVSRQWQVDLTKHSFAYLLTLDSTLADFPRCSLEQVLSAYGRPNQSFPIAGKLDQPKEVLLFFDHGSNAVPLMSSAETPKPATVIPRPLANLSVPACPSGRTSMDIVAHQDDDLLFMNPDILHAIHEGQCVRTVYITAGDAGTAAPYYWTGRESGAKDAYDMMDGVDRDLWIDHNAQLGPNQFVTISTPKDNPAISLIFMRLADGNLHGEGFRNTGRQSLRHLKQGAISVMYTVDGQSAYTLDKLRQALTLLIDTYKPHELRTQAYSEPNVTLDHSDHVAVGSIVHEVVDAYPAASDIALRYYQGYPIRLHPPNITGDDLAKKQAIFFAYARHDDNVCHSVQLCAKTAYAAYLDRQYPSD